LFSDLIRGSAGFIPSPPVIPSEPFRGLVSPNTGNQPSSGRLPSMTIVDSSLSSPAFNPGSNSDSPDQTQIFKTLNSEQTDEGRDPEKDEAYKLIRYDMPIFVSHYLSLFQLPP
jgi:hypothetical protein